MHFKKANQSLFSCFMNRFSLFPTPKPLFHTHFRRNMDRLYASSYSKSQIQQGNFSHLIKEEHLFSRLPNLHDKISRGIDTRFKIFHKQRKKWLAAGLEERHLSSRHFFTEIHKLISIMSDREESQKETHTINMYYILDCKAFVLEPSSPAV